MVSKGDVDKSVREGLGLVLILLVSALVYHDALNLVAGAAFVFLLYVWFLAPEDWNDGPVRGEES